MTEAEHAELYALRKFHEHAQDILHGAPEGKYHRKVLESWGWGRLLRTMEEMHNKVVAATPLRGTKSDIEVVEFHQLRDSHGYETGYRCLTGDSEEDRSGLYIKVGTKS